MTPIPIAPLTSKLVYSNLVANITLKHQVDNLGCSLDFHFPIIQHPKFVALWRIPPFYALPLYFYLRSRNYIIAWLNDRWYIDEVKRALTTLPVSSLIIHHSDVQQKSESANNFSDLSIGIKILLASFQYSYSTFTQLRQYTPSTKTTGLKRSQSHFIPSDTACVFFTSGTTSVPKAVMLTERNLVVQSLTKIDFLRLSSKTVYLHLAPLFHLGGFSSSLACVYSQATHIFPSPMLHPSNPADATKLIDLIEEQGVTFLVVVPTILRLLLDNALSRVLPSVTCILYGGSAANRTLVHDTSHTFPNASIVGAYGMTETASSMTFLSHNEFPEDSRVHASAGWAPSHVELKVYTSRCQKRGILKDVKDEIGEIITKGPHVTPGYYGDMRRDSFLQHAWFRTGDLGYIDSKSGALFLVGRLADMIKSGGEKVFAGEVENVLVRHPIVTEAAVVGLPHRVLGEAVTAAVVLSSSYEGNEEILQNVRQVCKDSLADYKCPKWIFQLEVLPRTVTGKIMKQQLRRALQLRTEPRVARL